VPLFLSIFVSRPPPRGSILLPQNYPPPSWLFRNEESEEFLDGRILTFRGIFSRFFFHDQEE